MTDPTPEQTWSVRFVCTDRGCHPSRELLLIERRADDPLLLAALAEEQGENKAPGIYADTQLRMALDRLPRPDRADDLDSYTARLEDLANSRPWRLPRCPTCRRDVRVSARRMQDIVARCAAAGVPRVDVSHLDRML